MKLIYAKGACSLSVHILLKELKIPHEAIKVSLQDKKVLDSYNPKSYVPAIVLDDGEVMSEATSILQFISLENDSAYLPRDAFERAKCIEWLTYISTELHKGAGPLFHKADLSESYLKQVHTKLDTRLQLLEDQLSEQAFIMGNNYTIADMYALAILRILGHVGIDLEKYTSITNYKKSLEESPVIKKVLQLEENAPTATEVRDLTKEQATYQYSETITEVNFREH